MRPSQFKIKLAKHYWNMTSTDNVCLRMYGLSSPQQDIHLAGNKLDCKSFKIDKNWSYKFDKGLGPGQMQYLSAAYLHFLAQFGASRTIFHNFTLGSV